MARERIVKKGPQSEQLTPQELERLERMLGDPVNLPATFKSWVRNWVEEQGIDVNWGNLSGIPEGVVGGAPIGSIYMWPSVTVPRNHLGLDGANVERVKYKPIYDIFGTQFGAGDGSTTFGLPDTRGRMAVGLGTHTDVNAIGDNEAAALGSRRPAHGHQTNTQGSHTHDGETSPVGDHSHPLGGNVGQGFNLTTGTAGETRSYLEPRGNATEGAGAHAHGITAYANGAHNHTAGPTSSAPVDSPAFITFLYIIRFA